MSYILRDLSVFCTCFPIVKKYIKQCNSKASFDLALSLTSTIFVKYIGHTKTRTFLFQISVPSEVSSYDSELSLSSCVVPSNMSTKTGPNARNVSSQSLSETFVFKLESDVARLSDPSNLYSVVSSLTNVSSHNWSAFLISLSSDPRGSSLVISGSYSFSSRKSTRLGFPGPKSAPMLASVPRPESVWHSMTPWKRYTNILLISWSLKVHLQLQQMITANLLCSVSLFFDVDQLRWLFETPPSSSEGYTQEDENKE